MWASWVGGGLSPDLFWSYTPSEIEVCMRGVRDKRREDHRDRAWLAYQIASLGVTQPKHWPDFDKMASLEQPRKLSQIEIDMVRVRNEDFIRTVQEAKRCKAQ